MARAVEAAVEVDPTLITTALSVNQSVSQSVKVEAMQSQNIFSKCEVDSRTPSFIIRLLTGHLAAWQAREPSENWLGAFRKTDA